jgi:hypothetical protein
MHEEGTQLSQSRYVFAAVILSLQVTTSADSHAELWTTKSLEVSTPAYYIQHLLIQRSFDRKRANRTTCKFGRACHRASRVYQ